MKHSSAMHISCAVSLFVVLTALSPAKGTALSTKSEDKTTDLVELERVELRLPEYLLGQESAAENVVENAEEIPEEILRTEIITEARSPFTGEPLTAAEYAQLQAELADSAGTPLVSEDLRYLIFLLQVRRAVKPIIPFL